MPGWTRRARERPPRTTGDAAAERLVALTLEGTPGNAAPWSTRSMARRVETDADPEPFTWTETLQAEPKNGYLPTIHRE